MEVASLTVFRHNPEMFYKWMRPLTNHILNAEPNPAHIALAKLQNAGFIHTIITQNIDTLHQRAGSTNVLEVHGSLETLTCVNCYKRYKYDGFINPYIEDGVIPTCPNCNHYLKPDVVLFEEQLPYKTWLKAKHSCDECDLMIVSGSSLVVMPVAGLPVRALDNGANLIVVNRTSTYIDERAEVTLTGDVADLIPAIAAMVFDV
jgi:NAD-dependent deacetylase